MEEYRNGLSAAGSAHIQIVDSGADLNKFFTVQRHGVGNTRKIRGNQFRCMDPHPADASKHAAQNMLPATASATP